MTHPRAESTIPSAASQIGSLVHRVLAQPGMTLDTAWQDTLFFPPVPEKEKERIAKLLEQFQNSPQGKALTAAKTIYRELPFVLSLEGTQVDGIIDCLYQDTTGSWTVLDYKTDQIKSTGVQDRARTYETQIKIYGAACLQILNLDEIQLALHFLSPNITQTQKFTKPAAARFLQDLAQKLKTP